MSVPEDVSWIRPICRSKKEGDADELSSALSKPRNEDNKARSDKSDLDLGENKIWLEFDVMVPGQVLNVDIDKQK